MNLVTKAITKRPFPQLPFMSEHDFDSFLQDRGFNVGITGIRSFVDSGLIETLDAATGDFHPFQIWPISRVFRALEVQLDTGISHHGVNPGGLKKYVDLNWPHRAQTLTDFPQSNTCLEFNHKLLPLLLWLESHFLPLVRGPRIGVVTVANSDLCTWRGWTKHSQLGDLLKEHSISIEHLSDWRDKTLFNAFRSDPSPDLYLLLRSMPFGQRDKFRGRLRLAYDLYELTEITRLFLEKVSDKPVKKEWDPTGPPDTLWVERVYGEQPKFGSPKFLRSVVRSYGLDPAYRVRWLVEGQTEKGFIVRYAEGLGANIREFVTIRNFRGDGAFRKQIAAIDEDLEAAKEEQCFVTLTFDESNCARIRKRTRNRLHGLIEGGLVNFRFVLNRPDFELANFTVDQLIEVAVNWALDLHKPIRMDIKSLAGKVTNRIEKKGETFDKALNSVLILNDELYTLSKGTEWGERLSDYLSDKRESDAKAGVYSESCLPKIERQILFVLKNSDPAIDYRLSVKHLDPTTLEIL